MTPVVPMSSPDTDVATVRAIAQAIADVPVEMDPGRMPLGVVLDHGELAAVARAALSAIPLDRVMEALRNLSGAHASLIAERFKSRTFPAAQADYDLAMTPVREADAALADLAPVLGERV